MRLFKCQSCSQIVYFENSKCEQCSSQLGFLPAQLTVTSLQPEGQMWRTLSSPNLLVKYCANAEYGACNWLIDAEDPLTYCLACRHNRTIPDLTVDKNLTRWQRLEIAKHRVFYSLLQLKLPLSTQSENPANGLAFDFLSDSEYGPRVLTGHDNGLITIALAEASHSERERRKAQLMEPYRSLIGHFRHEIGHYYWNILIRDGGRLDACRAIFGDDTRDYSEALKLHYENGPPLNWQDHHISAYAASHPWEDWAETWAHYFHIIDTLEMAHAFGIKIEPRLAEQTILSAHIDMESFGSVEMHKIVDAWLPLALAMNSLNRAMGNYDLYPFILNSAVVNKLSFVHEVVHSQETREAPSP